MERNRKIRCYVSENIAQRKIASTLLLHIKTSLL